MKNLKIIAGTSIVVLSIQFKPFEVFGGTRAVPNTMKCASYVCCLDQFKANKE